MASCDLQATKSQEDIVNDGSSKNVNDPEVELKKDSSGVTKIPGPVMLDASGSFISLSNRQYTSVMELAKRQSELRNSVQEKNSGVEETQKKEELDKENEMKLETLELKSNPNRMNQADDSGVQLDYSATDNSVVESESKELLVASPDQPILQHLLDKIPSSTSKIDMQRAEQQSLRELQRAVAEMEADVAAHSEALDNEIQKEREQEQNEMELLQPEVTQESPKLSDNNLVSHDLVSEGFATKNLVAEDPVAVEPTIVDSVAGTLTVDSIANELAAEEDSEDYVDDSLAEDLVEEDSIGEESVMEDTIAVATPLVEKHIEEKRIEEKPIEKEKVQITIQARLTPASSTTGSLTDRKMVRLDQLLDAENNIDLLRQLLENDTYNDVVDSSEMGTVNTGMDKAKIKDEEKPSGFLQTVLKVLCRRKMIQPILLCSLAVGLIYFIRKI